MASLAAEAKHDGRFVQVVRYLVEPDWDRLKRENDTEIAPGVHSFARLALGPTEVDPDFDNQSLAGVIYTTAKWLSEWRGDEFVVVQVAVEAIGPQGFIGAGIRGAEPRKSSLTTNPSEPSPKPMQRQRAQEQAILAKLRELGFDPQAVPKAPAGKKSAAKQAVMKALGYSKPVMDHAWKRLRADKLVKDAPA